MADDTRRWLMTGTLALAGAAGGGVAGYMLAPDITGVVASLAVAGFGLGGVLGTLFGGGWRSPKPPQPVATEPPPPRTAAPGTRARSRSRSSGRGRARLVRRAGRHAALLERRHLDDARLARAPDQAAMNAVTRVTTSDAGFYNICRINLAPPQPITGS